MPPRYAVFLSALLCAVFSGVVLSHFNAFRASGKNAFSVSQPTPRIVRVVPASGPIGGAISVPMELASQGDENAIGFSLTFDAATLGNPMVVLGSDAAGATLNVNATQAAQGRVGLALAFPANQKFAAGARQIVIVTFIISASATFGTTTINFGDQPVLSEASDVNANTLPLSFSSGAITITKGFEADVTPRPDGDNNGIVTVTDWVQIGRFVAGIDTASAGNEYQRADCAPRASLGNGRISITDWTQAGRYAAGLDPFTRAGGPTAPTSQSSVSNDQDKVSGARASIVRGALGMTASSNERLTIQMDSRGVENALGFSLVFNSAQWRFVSATAGRDASKAALQINADQAASGRIGIALALPARQVLRAGTRQLLVFEFTTVTGSQTLPLAMPLAASFGDAPVSREVASVDARPVAANYVMESAIAGVTGEHQLGLARRK